MNITVLRTAIVRTLAVAAATLLLVGFAACGGSDSNGNETGEPEPEGAPRDAETLIQTFLASAGVIEQEMPAAIETKGDVRNVELGDALIDITAVCDDAASLEASTAASALQRACDRFVHAGLVRAVASGNALFVLDGLNQARIQLAEFQDTG
jgi:hypothetical protein